jgi:uncharacterized membrane protein (DUF2068 family)
LVGNDGAAALLVLLEVYEIIHKPTALKALTLAVNVAIVVYKMTKRAGLPLARPRRTAHRRLDQ